MYRQNELHIICRWFRTEVLKMTLLEIAETCNSSFGTLAAFEQGRSSNINHLVTYLSLASDSQIEEFCTALKNSNINKEL